MVNEYPVPSYRVTRPELPAELPASYPVPSYPVPSYPSYRPELPRFGKGVNRWTVPE